jgi:hypothetical protein
MLVSGISLNFRFFIGLATHLVEVLQHCRQSSSVSVFLLTRKLYKHVFDPCAGRQIAKVSAKEVFIITVSFEHYRDISSLTLLCGQLQDG